APAELDVSELVVVDDTLAVGSRRFQRRVFLENDHYVLVVEVHRCRFAPVPAIAPDDDAISLQQFLEARARTCVRISGIIRDRRPPMILQFDHDGPCPTLAGYVALVTEDGIV